MKSAETGLITDSFVVSFANQDLCDESVKIGRTVVFAPLIKYLQKMGLPKRLNTIEDKVSSDEKISIEDELTLIFVGLSVRDKDKEKTVNRVCDVLDQIDYIGGYRRKVIDSLISFQIENFVKSKKDQDNLNEVVDMRVPVEELFLQVERESAFDEGYDKGKLENKEETVVNMLKESFDIATIQRISGCSSNQIFKIRDKYLAGK